MGRFGVGNAKSLQLKYVLPKEKFLVLQWQRLFHVKCNSLVVIDCTNHAAKNLISC
jgi:hypothetical protein